MNVLFIGVGYFPYVTAGEKNFYFQLIDKIGRTGKLKLEILSINDQNAPIYVQKTGDYQVRIHNLKRPFHLVRKNFYRKVNDKIYYHHRHKQPREMLERLVTLLYYDKYISKIIKSEKIECIHFMDNFGIAMRYLKWRYPHIQMSYAPANYDPRGMFYDKYLRSSFSCLDKLFPYTNAYKQILCGLGIPQERMEVIHWGVAVDNRRPVKSEMNAVRERYKCKPGDKLFLWSGWIQQIQEEDFYRSVAIAKEAVRKYHDIKFVFAFKPEIYNQKYEQEASERVQVLTNIHDFKKLLAAADVFFSPVGEKNSTVSPPLTWLEAMGMGTVILTTNVGGVDELIIDGENGFIAQDYSRICDKIGEIRLRDLRVISENARNFIRTHFNIEEVAEKYISVWAQKGDQNE